MDELKQAFRGMILRDLRPVEDRDGVRVGEDCRIYKEKAGGYTVRFLKGTEERSRKSVRDKLGTAGLEFKEVKDFTL